MSDEAELDALSPSKEEEGGGGRRRRREGSMVVVSGAATAATAGSLRRKSTIERYAPYSWGPHTHPLWEQRRSRRKNRVAERMSAAVVGGSGAYGESLLRSAPNEVISNEDYVMVFVGGVHNQLPRGRQQPVLVPKLDLSFVHQPPGMRQHLLKQMRNKDEHQVREEEARALAFAHKYQMQHLARNRVATDTTNTGTGGSSFAAFGHHHHSHNQHQKIGSLAPVREHRRASPARKTVSDSAAAKKVFSASSSLSLLGVPQSSSMPHMSSSSSQTQQRKDDTRKHASKKKSRWFSSFFTSKYASMSSDGVVRV